MSVTIYHNPGCGTSRNTLQYLRDQGFTPLVIEYLKTPPDKATLKSLLSQMGMKPAALIRGKGEIYETVIAPFPELTDAQLIDAMVANPILIERPIVVTPKGTRLCRPWETVKQIA
ncbi:MAG TPA: arsenate reductase (glutaredoxin) [Alphaproteobacteria bacterium]|jgi:arsenate reductase|nr:arsenate reductase (glutaredoxin) [Alphaproteobacteria bacterium]